MVIIWLLEHSTLSPKAAKPLQPPQLNSGPPSPRHRRFAVGTDLQSLETGHVQVSLVVVVLSGAAATHSARRMALRHTWLKRLHEQLSEQVVFKFFISTKHYLLNPNRVDAGDVLRIEQEQRDFGDIVMFHDLQDTFEMLTHKTLASFQYMSRYYSFDHLIKADDDTFIDVERFLSLLKGKPKSRFYWGFFRPSKVSREITKRRIYEADYNMCETYIPYAMGGGYLISGDLVRFIGAEHALGLWTTHRAEDAQIGLLLSSLDLTRHHENRFDVLMVPRPCIPEHIVHHKVSPKDMYLIDSGGLLCHHMPPYDTTAVTSLFGYDWTRPPQLCCKSDFRVPRESASTGYDQCTFYWSSHHQSYRRDHERTAEYHQFCTASTRN